MRPVVAITDYVKSAKEELKKVSWPSRQETLRYTYAVVALSLAVAVFFGLLDFVLNIGLEMLLKR